jgi:DNA-binding transcriptional ArsR family regulator
MPGDIDIAAMASLLADPTRVTMLLALGDGGAHPASELAHRARVTPATASIHLSRLLACGIISVEKQGRNRYYRLTNLAIGAALEDLAACSPSLAVHSLRDASVGEAIRRGRICYDHLAGKLGVEITQALVEKGMCVVLGEDYMLSDQGKYWLHDFGINNVPLEKKLPLVVPCHPDWSEHRRHIAGTVGAALMDRLFELGWIKHIPSSRAVCVTEQGRSGLCQEFGLQW